jgi:hypothetical protein
MCEHQREGYSCSGWNCAALRKERRGVVENIVRNRLHHTSWARQAEEEIID